MAMRRPIGRDRRMVAGQDSPPKAKRRPEPEGLPPQTERSFQEQVLELAKGLGWRSYHTWISLHSTGGFPDLVLVRRPRVVFAELKSERTKVTPAQQAWLDELKACGQEVFLWRPSDWDVLARVLR